MLVLGKIIGQPLPEILDCVDSSLHIIQSLILLKLSSLQLGHLHSLINIIYRLFSKVASSLRPELCRWYHDSGQFLGSCSSWQQLQIILAYL
ncbi:hypothetical protein PanWU01x14_346790 [Parasponia andersonii]|uniref:Uncharacterized protein n=1 Tax=Parasponia andersonii TaxID=3476 RepID=A0A2P5AC77_PARAD|nr:hypothetical protein PanWU01x14_346790 [Parasponia andersonii]